MEGFEEMIQDTWRNSENGCREGTENHVASVARNSVLLGCQCISHIPGAVNLCRTLSDS